MDLLRTLELLDEHITPSLCGAVFRRVRWTERERAWSLWALVEFWLAVIIRAPESLSHALVDVQEGRDTWVPRVKASPEAFFQRCRDMRWEFFAEVFRRFVGRLVETVPGRYCRPLSGLETRFADVLVIDGSRLSAMARKLKILWNERAVVLPGCLMVVYDLFRGMPRVVLFCADAAKAEMTRAKEALSAIRRESLLVGDRLYCTADFFEVLAGHGIWGVFRRTRQLGVRRLERVRRRRIGDGLLEEWVVEAGSGGRVPVQTLRLVRYKAGHRVFEVLTNVLESARLSGEEALDLYSCRWSIERMYFDLKEVLNLNRFYPANPNAIAMQVYAAATVYVAMRVAQSEVADTAGIEPEEISPAKFFPKMAASCNYYFARECGISDTVVANPGRRLIRPTHKGKRFATVPLTAILVEHRNGHRRKRRFCEARRHWKSLTHVRGYTKLIPRLS